MGSLSHFFIIFDNSNIEIISRLLIIPMLFSSNISSSYLNKRDVQICGPFLKYLS